MLQEIHPFVEDVNHSDLVIDLPKKDQVMTAFYEKNAKETWVVKLAPPRSRSCDELHRNTQVAQVLIRLLFSSFLYRIIPNFSKTDLRCPVEDRRNYAL